MLLLDGTVALSDRLSVSGFWDEIREAKATRAMLLSVGGFLLAQPPSPDDRDHSLISAASAPMMANFGEFETRFGVILTQAYGLSDYCVPLSQGLDTPKEKKLAMGRPVEGVQVRIVDDNDADMPVGEPGEIVIRKDGLPFATAQGYYKMPDATLAAWRNMWFHTGDRAYRDADGYFYFVDRKKDAIRRRGENISTFEVEAAIARHPGVADVAVYPVKAETREDDVGASVVFKEGMAVTAEELIKYCRNNMPYFMVPRYLDFRESLPRTMTQKVRKVEMREYVEANLDQVFDRDKAGITITRDR
jgi:crotonobetaine/carnitine-CoA ligase